MTTYQSGSTVKLTANFAGSDDVVFNPDSIESLKVYDSDKTLLNTYTSGDLTNDGTGVYYMHYTLPTAQYSHIYHEWSYIYNSVSDLIRGKVDLAYV